MLTTKNPDVHPLIQRLILRRAFLGFTQAKVAQEAGIARATISSMESGSSSPSLDTLSRYAKVVGLRPHLALVDSDLGEDEGARGYVLVIDEPD